MLFRSGSDIKNNKATYVTMVGLDKAKEKAKMLSDRAFTEIGVYAEKSLFLSELTVYLLNRDY